MLFQKVRLHKWPLSLVTTLVMPTLLSCGTVKAPSVKKVIFLLHGLNAPRSIRIQALQKTLTVQMKDAHVFSLKRENSMTASTEHQVYECEGQIKEILKSQKLEKNPICILGDSHGGLVAMEMARQFQKKLNIIGVITHCSPLEGTPAICANQEDLDQFSTILRPLEKLTCGKVNAKMLNPNDVFLSRGMSQLITNDLTPGSELLQNVAKTLQNTNIPTYCLGGQVQHFKKNFPVYLQFALGSHALGITNLPTFLDTAVSAGIEEAFCNILSSQHHDMLIPVFSQLATNVPKNRHVKRLLFDDYHHFLKMNEGKILEELLSIMEGLDWNEKH